MSTFVLQFLGPCLAPLAVNTPSPIKILSGADSGSTFQVDDVPQEGLFWSGNHTKVRLGYCGQVGWFGTGLHIWYMQGEGE